MNPERSHARALGASPKDLGGTTSYGMKQDIHPQYYSNAKIKCACGKEWTMSSTAKEASVGLCSNCHPFYTGTEKIVDTRGRVEKFKKRMEKTVSKARKK